MAYARPVLCRLCGFPAPDGGVPVSRVDREKLSEWCLRMLDTELDQDGIEKATFCQFCVADSRFEHQNSLDSGDNTEYSRWWKSAEIPILEKCTLEAEVKPCAVKIENLSTIQIAALSGRGSIDVNLKKQKIVYKCLYCPEEFRSKSKLRIHAIQTHTDKHIFYCHVCLQIFKSNSDKSAHFEKAHKDKFLCVYCGARFKQYLGLSRHMQNRHKKEAIQCRYTQRCGKYFRTESELEEHKQEVHLKSANKVKCVNKSATANLIGQHIKQGHGSETIRSDTFFHTDEEKEKHLEQGVHNNRHLQVDKAKNLTKEECIYCKNLYSDYRCLYYHVKNMHSDVKINCKWRGCRQYFLTDLDYKKHLDFAHSGQHLRNNHQRKCDTQIPKEQVNLRNKESYCNLCNRYYGTREMLENHKKGSMHLKNIQNGPFTCNFCQKQFLSLTRTCAHMMLVHFNFKQNSRFSCSKCDKSFTSKHILIRHIQSQHSFDSKFFVCHVCNFHFSSKYNLKYHLIRKHHIIHN